MPSNNNNNNNNDDDNNNGMQQGGGEQGQQGGEEQLQLLPSRDAPNAHAHDALDAHDAGDEYETMPFDIEFLLRNFCDRRCDVVWDPFVSRNGFAQRYMRRLGYRVYEPRRGENTDFFAYRAPPRGVTCIVSNVPFSKKQAILRRLVHEFRLPFALILGSEVIQRSYFSDLVRRQESSSGSTAATDRRRWTVYLPNLTVRYHRNGTVQPLARFKSAFFVYRAPAEEEEEEEGEEVGGEGGEGGEETNSDGGTLLDPNDPLAHVRFRLFDYETMLRGGGGGGGGGAAVPSAKQIYTSGARIGKRKR